MLFRFSVADEARHLDGRRSVCKIDRVKTVERILCRIPTYGFNYCGPCAKIYRKHIIDRHHLRFDESLTVGEDMVFNLCYFMYCDRCVMVNCELYHYEERAGSLTHKFDLRKRENDRIFNDHLKNLVEKNPELHSCGFLYWDNYVFSAANAFIAILKHIGEKKEVEKHIEAIEAENLEKRALRRCSLRLKPRYKLIYWCLLHRLGKQAYRILRKIYT